MSIKKKRLDIFYDELKDDIEKKLNLFDNIAVVKK